MHLEQQTPPAAHVLPVVGRPEITVAIDNALVDPRRNGAGAVLEVALDNMGFVNASHGWAVGDELIETIGQTLRGSLPDSEMVARTGGDRYTILLTGASRDVAEWVAGMVTELVRSCRLDVPQGTTGTTASVGMVPFGGRELTRHQILLEADLAMRRAKEGGRNRFASADAQSQRNLDASLHWAEQIREALECDGFHLVAQPIRPASGEGEVYAWEILVRLRPDEGELVPPAAFFPTAERFGLMESIDRWVTKRAIAIVGQSALREEDIRLTVNVASKSVQSTEFVNFVATELDRSCIDPSLLTFEIAEATAVGDPSAMHSFGEPLRKRGCKLLLDNFGVGYASLVHLRELPLDLVKIDGRFVRHLDSTPEDQVLVESLVRTAHASGLRVVAAFVPDDHVLEMLRGYGVDFVQGFHVGGQVEIHEHS